jgi:hypothetical protein
MPFPIQLARSNAICCAGALARPTVGEKEIRGWGASLARASVSRADQTSASLRSACGRRDVGGDTFSLSHIIGPISLSRSDPLPGIGSMTPKICSCEPSLRRAPSNAAGANLADVRCSSKSGNGADVLDRQVGARNGCEHSQQDCAFSLDDLVGTQQDRRRYFHAECLGGLEIDRQFEIRSLLHRQIGGLRTPENFRNVRSGALP